ncbi:MAG: signal peptidase I [Halobacteriota archaeon]|nr:signal peptidase I [Halobacteriota archaeon]
MGDKKEQENGSWIALIKDIVSSVLVVGAIVLTAYLISGTWPVVVAVESSSMEPNIMPGDLVFLQGPSRTEITTNEEEIDVSFEEYGDVIVFRPNGETKRTPIIHRAMYVINESDEMPNGRNAPHAGYITKGDNNHHPDQSGMLDPIKDEWVVGVARFRVPYLGHITLFVRGIFVD